MRLEQGQKPETVRIPVSAANSQAGIAPGIACNEGSSTAAPFACTPCVCEERENGRLKRLNSAKRPACFLHFVCLSFQAICYQLFFMHLLHRQLNIIFRFGHNYSVLTTFLLIVQIGISHITARFLTLSRPLQTSQPYPPRFISKSICDDFMCSYRTHSCNSLSPRLLLVFK